MADENNNKRAVRLVQKDEKAKAFLEALYDNEGEANYTEIRNGTGLDRSDTDNKINKLEDLGLIEQDGYDDGAQLGNRSPPRLFKLEQKCLDLIQSGKILVDELMSDGEEEEKPDNWEELQERLTKVENRQQLLRSTGQQKTDSELLDLIEQRMDEKYVSKEPMQEHLRSIDKALREETGKSLKEWHAECEITEEV